MNAHTEFGMLYHRAFSEASSFSMCFFVAVGNFDLDKSQKLFNFVG